MRVHWRKEKFISIFVLLIIFLVWEVISRFINNYIMPSPISVIQKLIEMLASGQLLEHIIASLSRSFLGYLIAATLAISFGVVVGWSKRVYLVLEPIFELCRAIPVIALIPLAILWLGIGEEPKIFIISLACFWPIFMNTLYGVRGVDNCLIKLAKSMNAKERDIIYKVVIPAASPYMFSGLRISLATSFILLVASEMIAANRGLGFLMLYFEDTFRIKEMYAVILTLSILVYLSVTILLKIENHFTRWHKETSIERR
jgi:NitT/TauT family transport system permease protein